MAGDKIRFGILGGREADLHVLGELQRRDDVQIVFIHDPDPHAVGMEIADVLGIEALRTSEEVAAAASRVSHVVVSEPRERFGRLPALLEEAGARILGQSETLDTFCGREPGSPVPASEEQPYSLEDALASFERLFDRQALLRFLLDVAVRAVGGTAGSIMIYSPETKELYIAWAVGLSERVVRSTRRRLGEGIAGAVARERRGRVIRSADAARLHDADRDRPDVRSALSVPLEWRDALIGVLNVSSNRTDRVLDEAGLATLERLAPRIARLVYESSRLETERIRASEVGLRRSMGRLTEKSLPTTARFTTIARLLADIVGAEAVEVYVATHEGDWLVLGGSNRRVAERPDLVRCEGGALSRAFLERRTVILVEEGDDERRRASVVYVPLELAEPHGVLQLEFGDRDRLESFLTIKDSIALEVARFVASEKRERRLRRELEALSRVSDAAPSLLACRTIDEVCDATARLVADALRCDRVSVRVHPGEGATGRRARFDRSETPDPHWPDEDEERFLALRKKRRPFSLAFLDFGPRRVDAPPRYHALVAMPIEIDGRLAGGIIAYDRRGRDALDEATFTPLDESILAQIVSVVVPVVRALSGREETGEVPSHEAVLGGNLDRFRRALETEIARSDRYHQPFTLILLRVRALEALYESDPARAAELAEDIRQGIQARTRKTDYGAWIRRGTWGIVSLDGTRRVRFLIARIVRYLERDFASAGHEGFAASDVEVGRAVYPGTSRTPDALIDEAEAALAPWQGD